ncbi:hypothetical protein ElyMa_002518700, partial [Elysia marginata]
TSYVNDDGRCTYCDDNNPIHPQRNAIDFVMFKGNYAASKAERTLDDSPAMSDHYGVKRTVCKRGD